MSQPIILRQTQKIDATGQAMGRLATQIATMLRGKNHPEYVPHVDAGDIVEVTNVDKVTFSGKKMDQKVYYRHSGYPGGLKTTKMGELFEGKPGEVLIRAVKQMLPNTRLRNGMMKRLFIK